MRKGYCCFYQPISHNEDFLKKQLPLWGRMESFTPTNSVPKEQHYSSCVCYFSSMFCLTLSESLGGYPQNLAYRLSKLAAAIPIPPSSGAPPPPPTAPPSTTPTKHSPPPPPTPPQCWLWTCWEVQIPYKG